MGQAEPSPRRAITPQLAMAAAAAPPEGIVLDSASRPQARPGRRLQVDTGGGHVPGHQRRLTVRTEAVR